MEQMKPVSEEDWARLRCIKARHEADLMRKANVVGVGVGFRRAHGKTKGEPAIVVSVTHKVARSRLDANDVIPGQIDGVPVEVRAVGELRALDACED